MKVEDSPVWWTNAAFVIAIHVLALYPTLFVSPWKSTKHYSWLSGATRLRSLGTATHHHPHLSATHG